MSYTKLFAFLLATILLATILLVSPCLSAFGMQTQEAPATLRGHVSARLADKSQPLPGVVVALQHTGSTGAPLEAVTNEAGEFVFENLPLGEVTLSVVLTGFDGFEKRIDVTT